MQNPRQSKGQMGGETLRSTMGLQDHQTCPNRRNLILVGIRNGGYHPDRHQHVSLGGRSDPRSERHPSLSDAGSFGGIGTISSNSHRGLSTTNPGDSPQEGEV